MIMMLFVTMIFCHIVDDYYLQGWLASAKQKKWWEENSPNPKYKFDYLVALFMHSFSWSYMIMLPIAWYTRLYSDNWSMYIVYLILNCLIHMIVDDMKANQLKINLVQDQCIHLLQIFVTWLVLVVQVL